MDIKSVSSKFNGRFIGPDDPDYNQARTVFPGDIDRKPAMIVRVRDANDIAQAIFFARDSNLPLAVRCGGHSAAGFGVNDGGIVIDLRDLKKIEINQTAKTAWIETGLTAKEVTNKLNEHNLVLGFGDTGSVGVGGITLSGGVGFLARKFGLAIDNLLACEIVTADGKLIRADDKKHPDLFWAIRGGGGNFGVTYRFKFQLHELTDVYGGMLLLPATLETITKFITLAAIAPNELSTIINIMPTPPMPMVPTEHHGKISIMALMMYAGDPTKGEKILHRFKKLAPPLADMTKRMRYKDIFFPDDETYHPTAVAKTFFMNSVNSTVAQVILDRLNQSDASIRAVQLRVLGGAIASIPISATAYAHRKHFIMGNVAAFYTTGEDKIVRHNWVNDLVTALQQGDNSAYVGFLGPDEESRIKDAYPGDTWNRLATTKHHYDPNNLFKNNFNIPPA